MWIGLLEHNYWSIKKMRRWPTFTLMPFCQAPDDLFPTCLSAQPIFGTYLRMQILSGLPPTSWHLTKLKISSVSRRSWPTLPPPKETILQVDASSRGIGAALTQDGKSVAFPSESLSETEQHYANIEGELLWALPLKSFAVESGHKPSET